MLGSAAMRSMIVTFSLLAACGGGDDDGGDDDGGAVDTEPQTLDGADAGDVGDYPAIAVDGSGDVHISYVDSASGSLKYVRSTGGAFGEPVTIDAAGGDVVQDTAIAVDG